MFVNCDHQRLAAKQLSSSGTRPLDRQVDATSLMLSRADALLHELLRDHLKYRHAVANSDFKENLFWMHALNAFILHMDLIILLKCE